MDYMLSDDTSTRDFKKKLTRVICNKNGFSAKMYDDSIQGPVIVITATKSNEEYIMHTENTYRTNYLDNFFREFGSSKLAFKKLAWLLAKDDEIVPYIGLSAIEVLYSLYDTTAYKVYKNSDIPKITLYKASNKDVYRMSIKVLDGIATSLNESPGKILNQLLEIQKAFDKKQED